MFDGKWLGGGVGTRVGGRKVVEETEVAVMGVEVPEEGAGGEDVSVGGVKERVKGVEFGPCADDVLVVFV